MSTAAASSPREWWPWIGHNAWRLQLAVFVVWAVSLFLTSVLSVLVLVASLVVYITLTIAEVVHDHKLCDECIAAWPLDPQAEVEQRRGWLRMEHRWADVRRWITVAISIVVVGIAVGLAVMVVVTGQSWPQRAFSIALYVWFGSTAYSRHVHKRLEPWCPWCHRDDGDDHFHPEPVTPPSVKSDR